MLYKKNQKSIMAFYGSYLPIEETVDMFSKHLGITLKKAESTILGIGYHYSGIMADTIRIRPFHESYSYGCKESYTTVVDILIKSGTNRQKMGKRNSLNARLRKITEVTLVFEQIGKV